MAKATTFLIFITMQYKENYGAHAWEGEGECPQYWKFKGGSDYVSRSLTLEEVQDGGIEEFAQSVIDSISYKDDHSEEYCIDWELRTEEEHKAALSDLKKEYGKDYTCFTPKSASDRADQLEKWEEERKAS